MAKNNKEIRDIYFEYYRTKRSREFMDQHDSWKSWLELKEKIERKRNRGGFPSRLPLPFWLPLPRICVSFMFTRSVNP